MEVNQGDIFWLDMGEPFGSEPGYLHPHVVIQNDIVNESKIRTVIACVITSNLRLVESPGNVLLHKGEANLSQSCVVNVSQVVTVDKKRLSNVIGTLTKNRVRQILRGLYLLLEPR